MIQENPSEHAYLPQPQIPQFPQLKISTNRFTTEFLTAFSMQLQDNALNVPQAFKLTV